MTNIMNFQARICKHITRSWYPNTEFGIGCQKVLKCTVYKPCYLHLLVSICLRLYTYRVASSIRSVASLCILRSSYQNTCVEWTVDCPTVACATTGPSVYICASACHVETHVACCMKAAASKACNTGRRGIHVPHGKRTNLNLLQEDLP